MAEKLAKISRATLLCKLGALLALATAWGAAAADDHRQHRHPEQAPGYVRQVSSYQLPETELRRSDGVKVNFRQAIDDGKPVVLNFIYTTCTAVCPIMSQSFAEFGQRLGAEGVQLHMLSISIDPEEDTPERLADYASRFAAGSQWRFYTGSGRASVMLQKAFQAYFGDKMHHRPIAFMRAAPGQPWVRLEGFTTPDDLLKEYRQLVARR